MEIRKSTAADFERIMEIYAYARSFMAATGNPNQWGPTNWPPAALVWDDIESGNGHVCEHEGRVVGVFCLAYGMDVEPTYRRIQDGSWLDDGPYGVIHRLAGDGSVRGIGAFCITWALERCGHLRIDTHGDNVVMQNLLEKLGFTHCGTIYVEEDDYPRFAYEKLAANGRGGNMTEHMQITQKAQACLEAMYPGGESDLMRTDPEFVERFANFAFDEVVDTVQLDDRTRYLGWLATLLGCQGIDEYRALLPAALCNGLAPEEVKEVVYQAVDYLGFGRVRPFFTATNEILEAQGIALPLQGQARTEPTRESRLAGGEEAQVAIFGEGMRDFKSKGHPDYPHINTWLVDNCFGDWYTRGALDLKDRELVTFCYIAAQGGCDPQLRAHAAGNLSVGNSRELLIRVISSNLPFIGYPRTLNALAALDAASQQ